MCKAHGQRALGALPSQRLKALGPLAREPTARAGECPETAIFSVGHGGDGAAGRWMDPGPSQGTPFRGQAPNFTGPLWRQGFAPVQSDDGAGVASGAGYQITLANLKSRPFTILIQGCKSYHKDKAGEKLPRKVAMVRNKSSSPPSIPASRAQPQRRHICDDDVASVPEP
ncbi:uncharacterized protein VDAG_00480 [Verticillium dahliae VdLs.17]|uniref:Uncharacterized protein n=1 Tax=Verticillium dahliae (strain VdLs.17 / ATCC MYA-4575 / FGSC 10137) TaxID=498257 RepID=G2WQ38_VERDV|nr:uncharacterized protein VDAG_00480 [Verticillium dahliae VdLs.17]EGY13798.1 hypothetical protein VDAG_00480 [Verticillium dahliae VdLs.17]